MTLQNSIVIKNGDGETEIYLSELDSLVDEFIADMDEETLSKPSTWLAVLKHIYMERFRPSRKLQHNSGSLLGDNPDAVEELWNWYCQTAYRFGRTPTICQFGILSGIDRRTIQGWKEGTWRKTNSRYSDTSKKMYAEAEAALEARAFESNSVAAIFGLKASHSWRETSPVPPEETQPERRDSIAEIAKRHGYELKMPEPPDLGEFDNIDVDE